MELSKVERLILANQYRILQHLVPGEAEQYEQARKILENGYSLEYSDLAGGFSAELLVDECQEVLDILDMFRALGDAYERLPNKAGINTRTLSFHGFDGNHETAYMGYARFLIHDQGRWQELSQIDLNCHFPALPMYRRMLEQWRRSSNRYQLTADDIMRIVGPTDAVTGEITAGAGGGSVN